MPEMMRLLPWAGGGGGRCVSGSGPGDGGAKDLSRVLMDSRLLVEKGVSGGGGGARERGMEIREGGVDRVEGCMIVIVVVEGVSEGIKTLPETTLHLCCPVEAPTATKAAAVTSASF